jgi:anti-sigma factor RsiW
MNCELFAGKLDAYADGEIPREDLAGIEAHLRACADCARAALARFQLKQAAKAAADRYAPSPGFRLRIEKSIRKDRPSVWTMAWRPGLLATAATLLLAVAFSLLWLRHTEREHAIAELLDLHIATLASANPVDVVSTDRHTVKPWFQGKLPFTFNLPELANTQFTLAGGKLFYFEHAPGAQLLYIAGKHEISVFIVQDRAGSMLTALAHTTSRERGFSVETWCDGGLCYAVLSDANAADVHALADLIRTAAR